MCDFKKSKFEKQSDVNVLLSEKKNITKSDITLYQKPARALHSGRQSFRSVTVVQLLHQVVNTTFSLLLSFFILCSTYRPIDSTDVKIDGNDHHKIITLRLSAFYSIRADNFQ